MNIFKKKAKGRVLEDTNTYHGKENEKKRSHEKDWDFGQWNRRKPLRMVSQKPNKNSVPKEENKNKGGSGAKGREKLNKLQAESFH